MNKKVIIVVMITLAVMGLSNTVFTAPLIEDLDFKVTGCGTFVLQGTPKLNNGTDNNGENNAMYTFDLKLIKEFENNSKILMRFEGGRGKGLDEKNKLQTYAVKDKDADPTLNPTADFVQPKITELFYQQSFLNNKFTANIGKLNVKAYFDNNKYAGSATSQFVTGCFATNQLIDTPKQRLGLRFGYAVVEKLDIDYGYFATHVDNFDEKGVNIIQATYKPSKKGNYRLYVWSNSGYYYSYRDFKKSGIYGIGVSADQALCENIGLFVRIGYRDPSVGKDKDKDSVKKDVPSPFLLWSVGAQVKGSYWSRTNDTIGLAVGQIYGSSDYKKYMKTVNIKVNGVDEERNYKDDAETEIELYYNFAINKYIALSPAIQYFANPRGGNAATNDNAIVYGIRTQINF
ncbi:MAG: carbohydrate porin [Endomicrobium sp.]|jgi:hypothetical protein|nr:carbohydrate porin [Endomicrobium sp.]